MSLNALLGPGGEHHCRDNSKKRGALGPNRGRYARPVGNGEAGAAGLDVGTGAADGEVLGVVGLADVDGMGVGVAEAQPLALAALGADVAVALGTGTGVAAPAFPLMGTATALALAVGRATGLALALATGTGVALAGATGAGVALALATGTGAALAVGTGTGVTQDGVVGIADALAVGATGAAEGLADVAACTAPVPAVAADAHPASSATPATLPSAQPAVTRVLRVVTCICSSSYRSDRQREIRAAHRKVAPSSQQPFAPSGRISTSGAASPGGTVRWPGGLPAPISPGPRTPSRKDGIGTR